MPKKVKDRYDGIYERKDTRQRYWIAYKDRNGVRRREGTDAQTKEQANSILAAKKLRVEEEKKFNKPLPSDDSFTVWADEFLKIQKKRIAKVSAKGHVTQAEYDRQAGIVDKHLKPYFGQMKLAAIGKSDVIGYIDSRMGEVSDGTIIKERNVLRRLFNIAIAKDKITTNPADGRSLHDHMPAEPEGRVRFLEIDEWKRLFQSCYIEPTSDEPAPVQWLQQAAGLALSLGARRGEIMNLALPDIDLERGSVDLRRTKNGRSRRVPINDLARMVLNAMEAPERKKKRDRGLLFTGFTPEQLSMRFIRACRDVGIEDFSLHDLRHTYASWLRMKGADLGEIKELLGHSDLRMTLRYAHLKKDHLAEAASRLNGVFMLPAPKNEEPEGAEQAAEGESA